MKCDHQWNGPRVDVETVTCSCCGVTQLDARMLETDIAPEVGSLRFENHQIRAAQHRTVTFLKKYGRHLVFCDSHHGRPCSCGFEDDLAKAIAMRR